jgi:hypothetical protein
MDFHLSFPRVPEYDLSLSITFRNPVILLQISAQSTLLYTQVLSYTYNGRFEHTSNVLTKGIKGLGQVMVL